MEDLSLEEWITKANQDIEQEKLKIPQMKAWIEQKRKEILGFEKSRSRADIRKLKKAKADVEEMQEKIVYLESGEAEKKLQDKARPFIAAKRKMMESHAADERLFKKVKHDAEESKSIAHEFASAIKKESPKVQISRNDICPTCKNVMLDSPHESRYICPLDGQYVPYLDTTQASMGFNEDVEITSFQYKRLNHFKDYLARLQAKESFVVPKSVLKRIMKVLTQRKIAKDDIDPILVRDVMKKLGLAKYYNYVAQICYKLTGIPPPRMDPEQEERVILCFIAIQIPFDSVCPEDRSNFLSYSYCMWQFCTLLRYEEFLPNITLLKGNDKLKGADEIYAQICAKLKWKFVPAAKHR